MAQPGEQSGQSGESSANTGAEAQQDNAEAIDYGQVLAEHQARFAEQGKTVSALKGKLAETEGQFARVRKAFVGEEEKAPNEYETRVGEHNKLMDYFLQQGLEAERAGKPMPLTVTLGTKLAQLGIQAEERAQALEAQLAELTAGLKRQQNPAFRQTEQAAAIMEGMVQEAIGQVYGDDPSGEVTRGVQYDAVCARINAEIKDLMKNEPQTWAKVRSNPKAMRNMVNHFMGDLIPPAVRAQMEHQKIMDTPQTAQELWTAFREARAGMENADSDRERAHYSRIMDEIRPDLLALQGAGRRDESKPSLNRLLSSR